MHMDMDMVGSTVVPPHLQIPPRITDYKHIYNGFDEKAQ